MLRIIQEVDRFSFHNVEAKLTIVPTDKTICKFAVDSNIRVIRECGQDDPVTNTCYQKAGLGGRQYVCSCDHDGCNSGADLQMVFATMVSFATVALLSPKFLL